MLEIDTGPSPSMILLGSEANTKVRRISMLEIDMRSPPHLKILISSEANTKGRRISMLKMDTGPSPSDDFAW